ncbi:MAG: ferrous iron transporter B [Acholeplasmatales bacterium]|nr:MAG: ferrous iron transporter B [Acholeplasmatales bacterium]
MATTHTHKQQTILMMGLPNVGKSAIFSRYTNMHVSVSNYPGTTVEITEGFMTLGASRVRIQDVPGIYRLDEGTDAAQQVAIDMLSTEPDAILFVLDAVNLESSLFLLMQVLDYKIPTVVALNRSDLSGRRGQHIDHRVFATRLHVPVVPTVAHENDTLDALKRALVKQLEAPDTDYILHVGDKERWTDIERMIRRAVKQPIDPFDPHDRTAFLIRPVSGLFMALIILGLTFGFVIGFGMALRQFILLPIFRGALFPWLIAVVERFVAHDVLRQALIGDYGFLIKGIEWPFALVLPYVISFYVMLSLLEDSGYLPRLAVLLDGYFKKIGLTGTSIIPLLLGYGCGIPAIMATRSLPSRTARIRVAVMVSFAVPCVSQTGAFIALLGEKSLFALFFVFGVSVLALVITGFVLDKLNKQPVPFTLMELPPMLMPKPKVFGKKVAMRIKYYVKDGAVPMIIAIFFTAFLYEFGVLNVLGRALSPLVSGWLRLPQEAATPLLLGIVRRELAVLPLFDMDLNMVQFITAALVALFYVPCIAMIATLAKEFNGRVAVGVFVFTTVAALFLGGLFARTATLLLLLFT